MSINIGLGDNLSARILLDSIKHHFSRIVINHSKDIIKQYRNDNQHYIQFINELGQELFSEPPYYFTNIPQQPFNQNGLLGLVRHYRGQCRKPNLDHLCQGQPIDSDYIVITTKVRCLSQRVLSPHLPEFFQRINHLAQLHQIVILGERTVENNVEYKNMTDTVYGLYDQIVENVPNTIDRTIPALGITVPNMTQIKQDLLLMKNAKYVITFGLGGNLWMSAGVANTVGFRHDNDYPSTQLTDLICNPNYNSVFLTQDWNAFMNRLT